MKYLNYPGRQNCHFLLPIPRVVLQCLIIVTLAFSFLPVTQTSAAGVTYVDAAATGGNNGTSWADAYTSLQAALNAPTSGTIWIAQGTYKPTSTTDRSSTFTVRSGMALYGGFPTGGGDGTYAARDPQKYITMLSGEIGTLSSGDNSYHVVTIGTTDATTLLDGFTIRDGNANVSSGSNSMGGGLYLVLGSPVLRNLRFEANQAETQGGGMSISQGNPMLDQVTFANNRVNSITFQYLGLGGGLFITGGSRATLQGVIFTGNYSRTSGGGMAVAANSSPVLRSVRFEANSSSYGGAGLDIMASSPILRDVVFENNQSSADGGGMNVGSQGNPTLVNVRFIRNKANSGAGITVYESNATLYNTTFLGNTATYGGGIFVWNGSVSLQNAIFVGNTAVRKTSTSGDYGGWGGGIESEYYSTVNLRNVTFSSNQAYLGKALYCASSFMGSNYIYNSILRDTNREIDCYGYMADHSLIQLYQNPDPLYVQTPNPGFDAVWGTPDDQYGDLHLQANSPVINAGKNSLMSVDSMDLDADGNTTELLPLDLDNAPRIIGAAVDIGAYEYNLNHAPVISSPLSLPDILEDTPTPSGAQVRVLLSGHASDMDENSLGLAIVSAEPYNGAWQTSLDGVNWVNLGRASDWNATLLSPDCWVRFIPNLNYNYIARLTVRAWDQTDGRTPGTTGVDVSANGLTTAYSAETSLLTIQVIPVNDAPSFVNGPDQTILEDEGAVAVSGWATQISPGPKDELPQQWTFLVSNDLNNLFAVQPAVAANGILSFTPAADAHGAASVTVRLKDDGSTLNGGVDTSQPQTFSITMKPVNDAPSFMKGADQNVLEDSGPQAVMGWATQIHAGPANETGQSLTFRLTTSNDALFAVPPTLTPGGDLTFTPAAHAYGSASVTIYLNDDGGTADGGVDISQPQTFMINISPLIDNTINLSASPNPAAYQQAVILTAQVEGRSLSTTAHPTGEVTFKDGSTVLGSISLQPVLPGTRPVAQAVLTVSNLASGNHTLTATYSGDSVYHNVTTSEPLTEAINRASAGVELNALTQTYTGKARSASVSTSPAGLAVRITYNGSTNAPLKAGSYTVYAEIIDPNFTGSATGTLTIGKAALNVEAVPISRAYGVPNPPLTYTFNGFVNEETSSVISGTPVLTTDAALDSAVGNYAIRVSLDSVSADNYQFQPVGSTLTVTQAGTSTVVTLVPKIATYGETIQFEAVVGRESAAEITPFGSLIFSIDGAPVRTAALDADGRASFIIGTIPAGDHIIQAQYVGDANQQGSSGTHELLVNPAAVTLTLDNLDVRYDGKPHSPTVTSSPAGLPYTITYNSSASQPVNAGLYTVVATIRDPNFSGSATAILTIQKAGLIVKAEDKTRVYGAGNPPLGYTTTGFVNGETAAVLSGSPRLATLAGLNSLVGTYRITIEQDTLNAQNYTFTFIDGNLVISKADTLSTMELSTSSIRAGQPVTITMTISPVVPAVGTPTGAITLLDGMTALGPLPLVDGKADLTISNLSTGEHDLKVSYSGDGNFNPSSSDAQTLSVGEVADLSLSMNASADHASPGSDLAYNLTITNHGPNPATQVVLTDTLPVGVILKTTSEGCTQANSVVTCHLGILANGASGTIQIIVTVPVDPTGDLINVAQVSGKETDPVDGNNRTSLLIPVFQESQRIYFPCIISEIE